MTNQYTPVFRGDRSVSGSEDRKYAGLGNGETAATLLRGVVMRVSPYDKTFPGIRCDVYVYSTNQYAAGPVHDVLVTYPYSGLQEGDVMLPRATTRNIEEIDKGVELGYLNPASLDGDHVLIGFIDGQLALPVVVGYLPHPSADEGKTDTDAIGYRMLPREADGNPKFSKHQGVYTGIGKDGNYEANTTKAHKGVDGVRTAAEGGGYTAEGEEVSSTEADAEGVATSGNYTIKLKQNAKLLIEFESGNKIELTDNDGVLKLSVDSVQIGNAAAEPAVLGDALSDWLTTPGGLSVQTAFGPSGPSVNPLTALQLSSSVTIKG
jgi:hypothetical protein